MSETELKTYLLWSKHASAVLTQLKVSCHVHTIQNLLNSSIWKHVTRQTIFPGLYITLTQTR